MAYFSGWLVALPGRLCAERSASVLLLGHDATMMLTLARYSLRHSYTFRGKLVLARIIYPITRLASFFSILDNNHSIRKCYGKMRKFAIHA